MRRRRLAPPYRLLSLLLDYPDEVLDAAQPQIAAEVARLPSSPQRAALERFSAWCLATPLEERQRRYVETFDLDRSASLHLTYHVYGDTRKRGLALLRLKRLYAAAGLELDSPELPDYLPVLLEFAASAPEGHGETLLAEQRAGLELVRLRLVEAESPWADVLEALAGGLPGLGPLERDRVRKLLAEGPPAEQVGLEPFAPPEVMPTGAHP